MKAGRYPARQYGLAAVLWLACVVRLADIGGHYGGRVGCRVLFPIVLGSGIGGALVLACFFAEYPWLLDAWLCVGYLSYILLMDRNGREYTPSGMAGLYGVLLLIAFV